MMLKKMNKKGIIVSSIIGIVFIIAIVILVIMYPKSTRKGYLEASKIYIESEKFDLVKIYLEEEYPQNGIFKSVNSSRRNEIYELMAKDSMDRIIELIEPKLESVDGKGEKDGVKIIKINIKSRGIDFTPLNTNKVNLKKAIYEIDFYKGKKLVDTQEYDWEGDLEAERSILLSTSSRAEFDKVDIKIKDVELAK